MKFLFVLALLVSSQSWSAKKPVDAFTFHWVCETESSLCKKLPKEGSTTSIWIEKKEFFNVSAEKIIQAHFNSIDPEPNTISFKLKPVFASALEKTTSKKIGKHLAVVFDDHVISAAPVVASIGSAWTLIKSPVKGGLPSWVSIPVDCTQMALPQCKKVVDEAKYENKEYSTVDCTAQLEDGYQASLCKNVDLKYQATLKKFQIKAVSTKKQ